MLNYQQVPDWGIISFILPHFPVNSYLLHRSMVLRICYPASSSPFRSIYVVRILQPLPLPSESETLG